MSYYVNIDGLQWRKDISENEFSLIEIRTFGPNEFIVVCGDIDLCDYSQEQINNFISGYYENLNDLKNHYDDHEVNCVIVECIFEQTSEEELVCFGPFNNTLLAEKYVINNLLK